MQQCHAFKYIYIYIISWSYYEPTLTWLRDQGLFSFPVLAGQGILKYTCTWYVWHTGGRNKAGRDP